MEQGWDPDVKKFLLKVLNSLSLGLLWLIACATAGIYFELGYTGGGKPLVYTILFYAGMFITLILLLRYFYNTWKNR